MCIRDRPQATPPLGVHQGEPHVVADTDEEAAEQEAIRDGISAAAMHTANIDDAIVHAAVQALSAVCDWDSLREPKGPLARLYAHASRDEPKPSDGVKLVHSIIERAEIQERIQELRLHQLREENSALREEIEADAAHSDPSLPVNAERDRRRDLENDVVREAVQALSVGSSWEDLRNPEGPLRPIYEHTTRYEASAGGGVTLVHTVIDDNEIRERIQVQIELKAENDKLRQERDELLQELSADKDAAEPGTRPILQPEPKRSNSGVRQQKWEQQQRACGAAQPAAPLPCLLYTSPSPRDQRGSRMPGWG